MNCNQLYGFQKLGLWLYARRRRITNFPIGRREDCASISLKGKFKVSLYLLSQLSSSSRFITMPRSKSKFSKAAKAIYNEQNLGTLNVLAQIMHVEEKPAKEVLGERLEKMAKDAGISLVQGTETPCKKEHGYSLGVRGQNAGVIWDYVSVTYVVECILLMTIQCVKRKCKVAPLFTAPPEAKALFEKDANTIAQAQKDRRAENAAAKKLASAETAAARAGERAEKVCSS